MSVLWHDSYLEIDKVSVESNEALSTKFFKLTERSQDLFQRGNFLSKVNIPEGILSAKHY